MIFITYLTVKFLIKRLKNFVGLASQKIMMFYINE